MVILALMEIKLTRSIVWSSNNIISSLYASWCTKLTYCQLNTPGFVPPLCPFFNSSTMPCNLFFLNSPSAFWRSPQYCQTVPQTNMFTIFEYFSELKYFVGQMKEKIYFSTIVFQIFYPATEFKKNWFRYASVRS